VFRRQASGLRIEVVSRRTVTRTCVGLIPASGAAAVFLLALASAALAQQGEARTSTAVTIHDGRSAVEGAVIQVLRLPRAGSLRSSPGVLVQTRTTIEGVAESRLPSLPGMIVVVDRPGYERLVGRYDEGRLPAEIRLREGLSIEGEVLAADGSGAAGAAVCVRWKGGEAPLPEDEVSRCADASDDGRFVVTGLSRFAEGDVAAEAGGLAGPRSGSPAPTGRRGRSHSG